MRRQLLCVGLFITTMRTGAMAQSRTREWLGDEADVFEAVVSAAFPGATIDWDAGEMHGPNGSTDKIEIRCYTDETREEHRVSAVAAQFPARIEAAVEKSIRVEQAMTGNRHTMIGIVPRGAGGELLETRVAKLDPNGDLSDCQEMQVLFHPWDAMFVGLNLVPSVVDPSAPFIEVSYRSLYEYEGALGVIQWLGIFDSRTMQYRALLPIGVSLERGNATEVFLIQRPAPREFEFRGQVTGRTWRYECAEPEKCLVPPEEVLGWMGRE
jgi:hypothetical protein